MPLYTVIADFKGGTYVGQAVADTADKAASDWLAMQPDHDLAAWGMSRETLERQIGRNHAVQLVGLVGVWCLTASIGDDLLLLNIIQTVSAAKHTA